MALGEFQEERQLLQADSLVMTNGRILGTQGFEHQELDTIETYVNYHLCVGHPSSNAVISGVDSIDFAGYAGESNWSLTFKASGFQAVPV